MLRQIIIMTGDGGTVLFQKGWLLGIVEEDKVGLLSGVLTAFEEFARQLMAMFVTYMEFGKVAAALVRDPHTELICVVFYDPEDGLRFGRILASHVLSSFIQEFDLLSSPLFNPSSAATGPAAVPSSADDLPSHSHIPPADSTRLSDDGGSTSSAQSNSSSIEGADNSAAAGQAQTLIIDSSPAKAMPNFSSFSDKIHEVIRNAPSALLEHLVLQGAHSEIEQALILFPDGRTVHTALRDEIGLVANLRALLTLSASLMGTQDTSFIEISLRSRTCHIHRVRDCSFVIISTLVRNPDSRTALNRHILEATQVLHKFLNLKNTVGLG